MPALEVDYDSDPGRRQAWVAPRDVHEIVGPELCGLVLDVGCGEGRLVRALAADAEWVGVDSSLHQIAECPYRPLVRGDMRALPFADNSFAAVVQLWCLYHCDEPSAVIAEARRVLQEGGRYYACTAARTSDPELVPESYPPTTFDAEDAVTIVAATFPDAAAEVWDDRFFPLETKDAVRAYCRHNRIPLERADAVALPLWLTKRGVLVRATKV